MLEEKIALKVTRLNYTKIIYVLILSKNVDLISGIFQKYNITSSKFDVVLKLVQQTLTLTGFFYCIMNYSIHAKVD